MSGVQSPLERSDKEEQELHILGRAQAFGIKTLEELVHQCAFEDESSRSTRLVSRKPYSQNLGLWCVLLDFQVLHFGEQGVRKLWHIMKDSGGRVDDFFQGPVSDHLWARLISTGIKNHTFLRQLCRHELKLGAKRPSLCVDIVGSLLAHNQPAAAYIFAQELQVSHPVTSDDVYDLFMQACNSSNRTALDNFLAVCKTFQKVRIYSRAIPYLCSQERFMDAWRMHKLLLSLGDLPSDFESVEPLITYIASTNSKFEEFLQDLKEHSVAYEAQARRIHEHEKGLQYGIASGTLNIVSSRTMGVQPSRLSDHFVARAFATKTFSFDLVLHGLRLLGLREIGPLALQQISLNAGIPSELCRRIELLKELGIDHGSSMYARVVTKLAAQGKATLLSDVLASDQHPEVFEDLDLQENLLAKYYRDSDWRQVDRTLAILRVANREFVRHERLSMEDTSLNMLLRSVLRAGYWSDIAKIIAQIKHRSGRLTVSTLRCMHDTILSKRQPGERPKVGKYFDDVGFLLSLYQCAAAVGIQIPPTFWREPVRRLGMSRRWNDLERMLFWLAATYSSRSAGFKRFVVSKEEHSISRIFSPSLQSAVVAWAFLYPKPRHTLSEGPFKLDFEDRQSDGTTIEIDRGVRVLRMLQNRYGVPIDETKVREVCLWGLRKCFAPEYFFGRLIRDNSRHKYSASLLPESLKRLNTAWSGPLFDIESNTLHKHILQPRRIKRLRQRSRTRFNGLDLQTQYRNRQALQEAGVPQQPEDLSNINGEYQSRIDTSRGKANTNVDPLNDIVMYRDIYNVSLEDYQRSHSTDENKKTA
jgi:hypothetical protein